MSNLECTVCLERYDLDKRQPKMLPCGGAHEVCAECLERLRQKHDPKKKEEFLCPECRERIPKDAKINTSRGLLAALEERAALALQLEESRSQLEMSRSHLRAGGVARPSQPSFTFGTAAPAPAPTAGGLFHFGGAAATPAGGAGVFAFGGGAAIEEPSEAEGQAAEAVTGMAVEDEPASARLHGGRLPPPPPSWPPPEQEAAGEAEAASAAAEEEAAAAEAARAKKAEKNRKKHEKAKVKAAKAKEEAAKAKAAEEAAAAESLLAVRVAAKAVKAGIRPKVAPAAGLKKGFFNSSPPAASASASASARPAAAAAAAAASSRSKPPSEREIFSMASSADGARRAGGAERLLAVGREHAVVDEKVALSFLCD